MECVLVCLFRGSAKREHVRLTKEISTRFNIEHPLKSRVPPHFTLKYPFGNVTPRRFNELVAVLKAFCKREAAGKVSLNGFGHFGNKVVYVKVRPSLGASSVFRKLCRSLKAIKWMTFDKYDGPDLVFHATLAVTNGANFRKVWNYVSEKRYAYSAKFDSISILKYRRGLWITHKTFSFAR